MANKRLRFFVVCCLLVISVVSTGKVQAEALLGERFERSLGKGAVPEIVKQYGGEYTLPIEERMWVGEVFRRLVDVTERSDLEYTLTVLNSAEANAFALPGGYVFITRGLLKVIGTDEAKLAAVLGHEMAHIEKKHGVNAVFRQMGLAVLMEVGVMVLDLASADLLRVASATLLQLLQLGWGREAEYEADALGMSFAVQAGFDGIGAISLLNNIFSLDASELPMKIFRTHPDIKDRRDRLVANLMLYWSTPVVVTDLQKLERLNIGRNSDQNGRSDPNGRYLAEYPQTAKLPQNEKQLGLEIYDKQQGQSLLWLGEALVREFAWSPQGQYLAVLVGGQLRGQLWICDRYGYVVKKITAPQYYGEIQDLSWSPDGKMLALDCTGPSGRQVAVLHLEAEVFLPGGGELKGSDSTWGENELYFRRDARWYSVLVPKTRPVIVANPVPKVLERKRILSPTVIKEGNTIRLTRPSLTLP